MKNTIEFALLSTLFLTAVNAQASCQQCAAEICCKSGNQDLSASCWSQCSSCQQQLAEMGCHILPPTQTSSVAPQGAPALTTSWGPGQFCQGYGPGEGGDTCMTIPAGCYVVPSGYNVVPQLYCTATATPSSTAASSTPPSMQITSSSIASSSNVPSSSMIPPSSTPSAPIFPFSSATTKVFSSASSALSSAAGPPITTSLSASSSASMAPTVITPVSVAPSSSIVSSSAVQSSALPVIVGGVAASAASASSAAQAFSQNPTTDTENALKKAVSAAQDAATSAKAVADAAAFTALSAELATVLTSLSEAAATLASAETLADIAAAVAPELAAAKAAATTAKEIENAGPDSPEATGQQPSANQPSVTQPSPTVSASSAAGSSVAPSSGSVMGSSSIAASSGSVASTASIAASSGSVASSSSAATVSSITSASASSFITSSATISASTCDACVACADSTIAPIPTPDPVDPFAEYAGSIDDNSTATKQRKRFHSANFIEIKERANSATRDVTICGTDFSAPSYNSYSGTGNGNLYSPYYSYAFQTPRCSTYNWALTQGPTEPDNLSYATEHIYELQLIAIFLRWLAANDANLQAYLAVNNRNICANFISQILFGQGQQWTVTTFGAGGNIKTPGSRPADELLSQMSGGAHADELVYLETHLNGLKAQLFGGHTPSTMTLPAAQLALVAESSALYLYLRDAHVASIFRAVSARVQAFYAKLDRACGRGGRGPCAAGVRWESSYQAWQAGYLSRIDGGWQGWKGAQVGAAVAQIVPKTRGSAMWQGLLDAVDAQTGTGLLSAGRYTFAGSLTI